MKAVLAGLVSAGGLWAGGPPAVEEERPWCGVESGGTDVAAIHEALLAEASFSASPSSTGEPAVIDVLFLYTTRTAAQWGGGLRARVEWMVDGASVMFLNSGANARLRLAALVPAPPYVQSAEDIYVERANYTTSVDLAWCSRAGVRGCEGADALMEQHGADLLYLLAENRYCGLSSITYRLSQLKTGRASGLNYLGIGFIDPAEDCMRAHVLAHEVGHNLTLVHDEREAPDAVPLLPGGRGFASRDRDGEDYLTIMAYPPGFRENRFSTSAGTYNGRVIGLPGRHEASSVLRYAAPYVASWRSSKYVEDVDYPCEETASSDCMGKGRFRVRASYRFPDTGLNEPALIRESYAGDNAGVFYFFEPDNPELLIKVLDGCGVNGHHWVFGSAATDLEYEVSVEDASDGTVLRYVRDGSDPLISDTRAFRCEGASAAAAAPAPAVSPPLPVSTLLAEALPERDGAAFVWEPGRCNDWNGNDGVAYSDCVVDGRFEVRAGYWPHSHWPGRERAHPGFFGLAAFRDSTIGDHASLFYFFKRDNPELLIKVVDGCAVNGHYWVFGSAATDLPYLVRVFDRDDYNDGSSTRRQYIRDRSDPLISDIEAFRCEPD